MARIAWADKHCHPQGMTVSPPIDDARARFLLRAIHDAAIAASQPARLMRGHVPPAPAGRCVVIGAGKASAAMASALDAALLERWGPGVPVSGVVATRHGHGAGLPSGRIAVVEAGHPVPDQHSLAAAQAIVAALHGLTADDLVIALISGGGSACMEWPVDGLDLAGLQALTRAMLESGAGIAEINTVRRHLSRVKGGRLAALATPARVLTLVISDVPGDDPAAVASGPTLADGTTPADALAIIARYRLPVPAPVLAALRQAGPVVAGAGETRVIASPRRALEAAVAQARALGLNPLVLGDTLEGEARELGRAMAGIARSAQAWGDPVRAPAVILSGGETTVTLVGGPIGRGGRNCEFALALALALDGLPGVWALAADSDGIDGSEDAAGAFVAPDTLARARAAGLGAGEALAGHDSYSFFAALGDLLITGPTHTNVNDIRLVLVT
ncbi:glycerate kinase [Novosphingobium sp. SG720]|uniref:glycerate kinase type-2 family protein n=1 Tax=Novosphingobium sp. SG720 TaxID=2586998 RepID=UPI001FF08715|nr:glycerate kinase [Novosphingobium sp. SG720]